MNTVVSSVATIWRILEGAGDIGHAGRQPEPLPPLPPPPPPPAFCCFHVLQNTKEKHASNKGGGKILLNWHPCFISATHLTASATTLEIFFLLFHILSTSSLSVLFIILYVLIPTEEMQTILKKQKNHSSFEYLGGDYGRCQCNPYRRQDSNHQST